MDLNFRFILPSTIAVLVLALSGCGSSHDHDTARIFTDEDIEILASLDEENLGSGQTMVEIVATPMPPQAPVNVAGTAGQIQEAVVEAIATAPEASVEEAPASAQTTIQAPQKSTSALSFEEKIQTALHQAGYYSGVIDGKVGPQTRKAIRSFQEENGLKADGLVGPTTWQALRKHYSDQE